MVVAEVELEKVPELGNLVGEQAGNLVGVGVEKYEVLEPIDESVEREAAILATEAEPVEVNTGNTFLAFIRQHQACKAFVLADITTSPGFQDPHGVLV